MEFVRDADGREMLLKDGKFQVMMEWEKPYMEACIDALAPTGDLLEVGFGCGYASTRIQTYHPRSHTIIEYHPVVAERARLWAKDYKGVTIIEDTWQQAMPHLGEFDAIFFDDYPLEDERKQRENQETKKAAHAVLETGKQLLKEVEEKIPFLQSIVYTEQAIDEFLISAEKAAPEVYLRFFFDLEKRGQIDRVLLGYAMKRLLEQKLVTHQVLEAFVKEREASSAFLFQHQGDRLFHFLQLCLKHHMRKGAVFSCYLEDATSKFEDENFFTQIITNPFLEYKESWVPVQVPEHCNYFKGDKALVMTVRLL